jgi:copper transport protein
VRFWTVASMISRTLRALLVALSALVLVVGWAPSSVSAHTSLIGSEPSYASTVQSAPTEIRLVFDNPTEPGLVKLRLRDAEGNEVGKGELVGERLPTTSIIFALPEHGVGEWSVSWVAFAFDGHVVSGSIPYTVDPAATGSTAAPGQISPPPELPSDASGSSNTVIDIAEIQARFVSYLALAVLFGAAGWVLLIGRASGPVADLVGRSAASAVPVAAVAAALALLGRGSVALWRLLDGGFEVAELPALVGTGQLGAYLLAAILAATAVRRSATWWPLAAGTAAGLVASSVGHAASYSAPGIGAVLAGAHTVAGVAWVGAVVVFAYVASDSSFSAIEDRWTALRPSLETLGRWLIAGAVVLTVTGVRSAMVYANGVPSGRWGLTLAAKLALVLVASMLGAFHFWRGRRGRGLSVATLSIEAVVLCLTLTAAAVLSTTTPG